MSTAPTNLVGNEPALGGVLGWQGKVRLPLYQIAVIRLAVRPGHIEPRVERALLHATGKQARRLAQIVKHADLDQSMGSRR